MKLESLLIDCGLTLYQAKLITQFLKDPDMEVSSRALERVCDMRQPEASIALKSLIERKWVGVIAPKASEKGRPVKLYFLRISGDEIYLDIEKGFIKDIDRLNKTLKELKAAMTSSKSAGIEHVPKGQQLSLISGEEIPSA